MKQKITVRAALLALAFALQLECGWTQQNTTGSTLSGAPVPSSGKRTAIMKIDDFGARGDGSADDTKVAALSIRLMMNRFLGFTRK